MCTEGRVRQISRELRPHGPKEGKRRRVTKEREGTDPCAFKCHARVKPRRGLNGSAHRNAVVASYYNDNDSIIDTHNINRWSTTPFNKLNKPDEILLDDMTPKVEEGNKRSSRIRTSLDLDQLTTVESLSGARGEYRN